MYITTLALLNVNTIETFVLSNIIRIQLKYGFNDLCFKLYKYDYLLAIIIIQLKLFKVIYFMM